MRSPMGPLLRYLVEHFSAADLRLFLGLNYPEVVSGLPDPSIGQTHFAFAALERLRQFNFLKPELFVLLRERPGDHDALRAAAIACLNFDPLGGPVGANYAERAVALVLMARPDGQAALGLDLEAALIGDQLGLGALRERFSTVWGWSVRAEQILDLVVSHRPTLLHFGGHGGRDGTLLLAGAHGTTLRLRYEALGRFLGALRRPPRCVVLNACFSGEGAAALTDHVDLVIGMRDEISDDAAITFARHFYRALAQRHDVQAAFDLARAALDVLDHASSHLPMLSCRAGVDAKAIFF